MRLSVLVGVLALVVTPAHAAPRWIGTWGASPAPPVLPGPNVPPRMLAPSFENQTIVQVVRVSAGGQRLRLRFSNEYGQKPLAIGAARIALIGADGAVLAGSERPVTFAGAPTAVAPPAAPLLSDPVALKVPSLARLRVSLFLPGPTGPCTCHMSGQEFVAVAGPGDLTDKPVPAATGPAQYRAFLTGVEVESASAGRVIVTLGDSITDGALATPGKNSRWPDRLAERLAAKYPGRAMAVVNAGIGGNRVLSDPPIAMFGQNALSRFDRDVLSVPGVTDVVVLEGVNDLGARTGRPSATEMIAGYRQLIDRAHAHGLRIHGATILPYGGAGYFTAEGEATRQAINAWIRKPGNFDGVVDLDAAIRDPARPERMRPEWHGGDWLHPNDAGYRVMGDAVDLALFR
ncbi:SGNH/GDSL hydrolase family protein [uncultured Phenylobacterium sp.]|uniref:SGNH/GDSL hydrolase family protein n=1 Tax=uncultured Phenylobacterium sp. TaxID=349273 RepID=UPI0025D3379D|nr:SGNH/GDSL hydrolase family protein [uncultured Phenylobacterium sp.]